LLSFQCIVSRSNQLAVRTEGHWPEAARRGFGNETHIIASLIIFLDRLKCHDLLFSCDIPHIYNALILVFVRLDLCVLCHGDFSSVRSEHSSCLSSWISQWKLLLFSVILGIKQAKLAIGRTCQPLAIQAESRCLEVVAFQK